MEIEKLEFIAEKDVPRHWPFIAAQALRRARCAGQITWIRGKRGSAWYRPADVEAYVKNFLELPSAAKPYREHLEKSPGRPVDLNIPPEILDRVAKACANKI